jgi:hypothetical protein
MNDITNDIITAIHTPQTRDGKSAHVSGLQRFLRRQLHANLAGLRHGRLTIEDALGAVTLGLPSSKSSESPAPCAGSELHIRLRVRDMAFYSAIAGNGSVGAGAAYGDGLWQCDDLVGLVQLLVLNRDLLDGMETGMARAGSAVMRLWHALRRNTREGSRRNIAAHYDLGNDFFGIFLSPDLMYSAANSICSPASAWSKSAAAGAASRCMRCAITAATSPPSPFRANSMRWRCSALPQPAWPIRLTCNCATTATWMANTTSWSQSKWSRQSARNTWKPISGKSQVC